MKVYYFILFILFASCSNFQQVQLEQTEPINPKLAIGSIPSSSVLLLHGNGLIDDFNSVENKWETDSSNIFLGIYDGKLLVKATAVGPAYEYFYRSYNPLDFSKASKIIVAYTSPDTAKPYLVLQMVDKNENKTFVAPSYEKNKIIFPLDPDLYTASFDPSSVIEVRFFVHPGATPYTGEIFIDAIRAVK